MAAVATLIVATLVGEKNKSLKDISTASNIAIVTMKKSFNEVLKYIDIVIPQKWKHYEQRN